jgi:hypothetical protein
MAEPSSLQTTLSPELASLHRAIHALVHGAMADGWVPTAVEVGWREYGVLYRQPSLEPDGQRPRSVLDLPLVLVGTADHLALRCTRSGW